MSDLNEVFDAIAKAAEQHRADEVRTRADDLLVDGKLVITEAALERLKADASVTGFGDVDVIASETIPPWALVGVQAIPDDGAPHDIGNGKVAVVSPIDHKTIFVMPADLLDRPPAPMPMRLLDLPPIPRGDGPAFA